MTHSVSSALRYIQRSCKNHISLDGVACFLHLVEQCRIAHDPGRVLRASGGTKDLLDLCKVVGVKGLL